MEHRRVGSSGLRVSVLGLGTMTFGAESDEATSDAILDRFAASGGTLIDTADVYSAGRSEEIVGRWLATQPDQGRFVIATKGRFSMGEGPSNSGAGRAHLMRAVDASLRRLQVDVIDLYQVHCSDAETPIEETLEALDDLVRADKVRYVGLSNYTGYQFARAATTARLQQLTRIVSLQAQYSLLERTIELDLVPACLDEGAGILPWSPLGGGWLTGKYAPDRLPTGATRLGEDPTRGVEAYELRNTDRTWKIIEACSTIATKHAVALSVVALAWLRDRPAVCSVILGTRSLQQLDENLQASDFELSPDEREFLDQASAPGIPLYPHGFIERYGGNRVWERMATRNEPPPIGA